MAIAPTPAPRIHAVCCGCTLIMVRRVYLRHPWVRLLRGPLWLGMWLLSWWHGFSPHDYLVRNRSCYNCIRFRKNILVERSMLFRLLSRLIGPPFMTFLRWLAGPGDKELNAGFVKHSLYRSLEEALLDEQPNPESSTRFNAPVP